MIQRYLQTERNHIGIFIRIKKILFKVVILTTKIWFTDSFRMEKKGSLNKPVFHFRMQPVESWKYNELSLELHASLQI